MAKQNLRNYLSILAFGASLGFAYSTNAGVGSGVTVALKNGAGEEVGTARITPAERGGVRVVAEVDGLPPGVHAIHFHQNGTCTAPDFKSAGEHFSPEPRKHGLKAEGGPHAGDLPNLTVEKNGKGKLEFVNAHLTLGPKSLQKSGGTTLVVHTGPDDHHSQPAGNSGDRIACGEVKAL